MSDMSDLRLEKCQSLRVELYYNKLNKELSLNEPLSLANNPKGEPSK